MYIKVVNLRKRFEYSDNVIDKITFTLGYGEKVGLIGKNGAGKSTLLKVLAGLDTLTSGQITKDPKDMSIIYHEQVIMDTTRTIKDFIISSNPKLRVIKEKLDKEFSQKLFAEYEENHGFKIESKIKEVLGKLGLSKFNEDTLISNLSGGEKTRLQIAPIIISTPNLLLLDEPTNNLDLDGIKYIQEYIKMYKGIIIIATHDRALLEESTNRIIEIEKGQILNIKGNYKHFLLEKEIIKDHEKEEYKRKQHELKRTMETARTYDQARRSIEDQTKYKRSDGDKMGFNFSSQKAAKKFARKTELLHKKINEYESTIKKPIKDWRLKLDLSSNPTLKVAIKAEHIEKKYGDKLILKDITLEFNSNEKTAIIGRNGSGKTTFLKILLGEVVPTEGIVITNESLKFAYLSQDHLEIDIEKTILEDFMNAYTANETISRTYLHRFLFKEEEVNRKIGTFSQGEKAKYAMAKILFSNPDFLILDEPTNYLDLDSKEIIEKALFDFTGGIIVATHDRNLIKAITPDKIIDFSRLI